MESLWQALEAELPAACELRRTLHRHPEVSGSEHTTRARVLTALGIPGVEIAETGAPWCGSGLAAARPSPYALSSMHCLLTAAGASWASEVPGVMHACGHDVHLAALVAVARAVERSGEGLPPLLAVFQPREERYPSGARDIVEEDVLDDCAAVIGVHLHPELEPGTAACSAGTVNASADEFTITLTGHPGHAGYPHLATDPVVAIAHVIVALQTAVSRSTDPMTPSVLGVSSVHAGDAANAIPTTAVARGTIRAYDAAARELLHRRLTAISESVAAGLGCRADVEIVRGEPVLSNDAELTTAVRTMLGARGFDTSAELRSMGADDFSYFAEKIPAVMLFVGASGNEMLHSPAFLPDDADLTRVATAMLASYLAAGQVVGLAERRSEAYEVEAGLAVLEAAGGDRVQVALAEQDVVVAADLDLGPVLRVEQHPVVDLDRAHVGADRDHLRPGQPAAHLRGGRDQDAGRRLPLALLLERRPAPGRAASGSAACRRRAACEKSPATHQPADQQQDAEHADAAPPTATIFWVRSWPLLVEHLGLGLLDLPHGDVLRVRPVDQLVHGRGQARPGGGDVRLDLLGGPSLRVRHLSALPSIGRGCPGDGRACPCDPSSQVIPASPRPP